MRSDQASMHLLLAYAYATRWFVQTGSGRDLKSSLHSYGRATRILSERLRSRENNYSDVNVQTLLLLLAYTSDFSQASESQIHIEALRAMIEQRGGVGSFINNWYYISKYTQSTFQGNSILHLVLHDQTQVCS
jgi:hypothetical protein